jgi:hypothetical protein
LIVTRIKLAYTKYSDFQGVVIIKHLLKLVLLFSVLAIPLFAEVIMLKDGSVINGTVMSSDAFAIKVKTSFGELTVDKFNILNISYSNDSDISKSPVQINVNQNNTNVIEPQKKSATNNSDKRPFVKWAIGAGIPYALFGNQFGVVFSDNFELFAAFSSLPGYDDNYYYNSTNYSYYSYSYEIFTVGARYYYDTSSSAWIPGTGAYVSIALMPYKYLSSDVYKSGSYYYNNQYNYDATIGMIGLGVDGKFGLLHANIELGYGLVLSEKYTNSSGTTFSAPKAGGITFAVGIGIAI